jgi:hypothetical protein
MLLETDHGARDAEQARFLSGHLGDLVLQVVRRLVLAIDVVTARSMAHQVEHFVGRHRDRVPVGVFIRFGRMDHPHRISRVSERSLLREQTGPCIGPPGLTCGSPSRSF